MASIPSGNKERKKKKEMVISRPKLNFYIGPLYDTSRFQTKCTHLAQGGSGEGTSLCQGGDNDKRTF